MSELSENVESVNVKDKNSKSQRQLIDSKIFAKVKQPHAVQNKPSTFGSLEDDFDIIDKPYEPQTLIDHKPKKTYPID